MAIFRDPTLSPASPAVLLPAHQAKLYDDVHEIDTETGSGQSLSFQSSDDSIFDGFDTISSAVVFSSGFVELDVPQQFEDDAVLEKTTPLTLPGEPFLVRLARPEGCPVEPCRIIVDLRNLTIKTQRWAALPSIPENEAIFTKTPWWKSCFFGYSAEWDFDMAL
jgi:hypothetical protein